MATDQHICVNLTSYAVTSLAKTGDQHGPSTPALAVQCTLQSGHILYSTSPNSKGQVLEF